MNEFISNLDSNLQSVSSQSLSIQKSFLIKTYFHLLLATGIFAVSLYYILTTQVVLNVLFSLYTLPFAGLIILASIIGISFVATFLVNTQSKPLQYIGLVIYPIMESILFVPLILSFVGRSAYSSLLNASWLTFLVFGLLTAVVFVTKPDLGFLSKFLGFASISAIVLIVLSLIFGFALGTWFSIAMIMLAAGYILYQTSEMLENYSSEGYVGAALSLFASVAMLFFYILRLFGSRD